VEVIAGGKLRLVHIAPRLRVEMQAEHEIGLQFVVDHRGAMPDFVHSGKTTTRYETAPTSRGVDRRSPE
jgi:hypothetical protein